MKLKDCPFKPHNKEIGIIGIPAIFPTQETKGSWQGAVGEKEHVKYTHKERWGCRVGAPSMSHTETQPAAVGSLGKRKLKNGPRIECYTTLVPFKKGNRCLDGSVG